MHDRISEAKYAWPTAMRVRGKRNGVKLLKIQGFWQKGVLANGPWPHLGGPCTGVRASRGAGIPPCKHRPAPGATICF